MNTLENTTPQQLAYVYLTVSQFCQKHTAFKLGGVRDRIFHADKNGLKASGAIVRNGRKVLINEVKWFAWIESQNQGGVK
jgi:hypothetical protein